MDIPLSNFQNEIYLRGLEGDVPPYATDLTRLEDAARDVMSPEAFGYVAGSAGSESTARANRAAFERHRIVPRMLVDVTAYDFSTTVLGTRMPAPVLLAPVGVLSIVHDEGELAVARAASKLRVPVVSSTVSSYAMEEIAEASGDGPRWFQLYWPNQDGVAASFLDRARKAGFETLVVTLDVKQLAWRPRDLDRAFLPFLREIGMANFTSDPVFREGLSGPEDTVMHWVRMFNRPQLTWDDLPFLRRHWDGPIVLKGVQTITDANRAVAAGMDGIVVSNHGGRQVDGAIASLDALPGIADAVGDRMAVLFDSGVRTGADVVKALALGAQAVLIGRPYAYGLGLGGEDGVTHVLRCLLAEFELTMRLSGHATLGDLGPATIRAD